MDKTPVRLKPPMARAMSKAPLTALNMPLPKSVITIGALSENVNIVKRGMAGPVPVLNAKFDVDMGDIVIVSEDPETAKLKQELQLPPPSVTVVCAWAIIQLNAMPSAKTRKPTSIFRIEISPGRFRLRAPGWDHGDTSPMADAQIEYHPYFDHGQDLWQVPTWV
jgi:hypothetical protein